jgi:hypothetical protein
MQSFAMQSFFQEFNVSFYFTARTKHGTNLQNSECIVFPFIIWFYGSAIVVMAVQLLGAGVVVLAIVKIL